MKKLYRYELEYKSWDDDTKVRLTEYPVLGESEKTWTIRVDYNTRNKHIRKESVKRWAWETKEEAMTDFIRRTKKRIEWYEFWAEECRKGVELAEKGEVI